MINSLNNNSVHRNLWSEHRNKLNNIDYFSGVDDAVWVTELSGTVGCQLSHRVVGNRRVSAPPPPLPTCCPPTPLATCCPPTPLATCCSPFKPRPLTLLAWVSIKYILLTLYNVTSFLLFLNYFSIQNTLLSVNYA